MSFLPKSIVGLLAILSWQMLAQTAPVIPSGTFDLHVEERVGRGASIIFFVARNSHLQQRHENEGGKGFSDAALSQFALAAHTVSDRTSPSHEGEQVWLNPVTHPNEISPHNAGESNATDEQIKAAVEVVRQAFIEAFGARKAQEAFGNEQQTPPKNAER